MSSYNAFYDDFAVDSDGEEEWEEVSFERGDIEVADNPIRCDTRGTRGTRSSIQSASRRDQRGMSKVLRKLGMR